MIFPMEELQDQSIVELALPSSPAPDASPSSKGGKARMRDMTPAKRRALGRKAAQARWSKQAVESGATTAVTAPKIKAIYAPRRNHASGGVSRKQRKVFTKQERVFGIALTAAEKRLAAAIEERARAAATWAVLNAEIPSLQRTIGALRNQQNPPAFPQGYETALPDGSMSGAPQAGYTLDSVLSDAAVPFARPVPSPLRIQMPPQPSMAAAPRPPAAARVGGGAVGVNLGDGGEDDDKFLNDSGVASGTWH